MELVSTSTGLAPTPALDRHPAAVYLAQLSPRSRPVQRIALDRIAEILTEGRHDVISMPWHELRYQHTAVVRAKLADRYAPATANRMLAALRGTLREAWRLGLMDVEACERACDVKPVKGQREPAGRALRGDELRLLFDVCTGPYAADRRDAALLACLYSGGFRRAEAVALDVADYDQAEGSVLIRSGKNNKDRRVYLADFAAERLAAYLDACALEDGPIFRRVVKGGRLTGERLTDAAVRYIIRRRCDQAAVRAANPHDFRRSMVSSLLDAGVDLATVQQIAGHSNPTTTARYDRRGNEAKRRAAQRLTL
jgi:site-specific recombinase XerD